jgi:hypothetical protein
MMGITAWIELLLFMGLLLSASLYVLAASGHFPYEHRSASLKSAVGTAVLFGSMAAVCACLLIGLVSIWDSVPWYAGIIAGGSVILAAPLVLRAFPDSFVNSRVALLGFLAVAAVISLAMAEIS